MPIGKYFVSKLRKAKSILEARVSKTTLLVFSKRVDNLTFLNEESNGTFRLQKNTVYELQCINFIITFKRKYRRKLNHYTSMSQQNYK